MKRFLYCYCLGISILHKKIGKQDPNIFAFMDPLDIDVWVYTATLYLGMSILIYCIARYLFKKIPLYKIINQSSTNVYFSSGTFIKLSKFILYSVL